jgi:glutamine amidotransferase-like uncharacterized protein
MKNTSKPLRLFNGRSHGGKYQRYYVYVAAKSVAQAAKLVSMACFDGRDNLVSASEINTYYNKGSWGNRMNGIEPTEPCVYLCDESNFNNKPFRVI